MRASFPANPFKYRANRSESCWPRSRNFLRGKTISQVIRLVLGSNINEENNPIIIRYLNKIVQDTTATNTYTLIAKLTKRIDELEKIVSDLNDKLNHS